MRPLTYTESKLLKKTDFFKWEADNNFHESTIINNFKLSKREDYIKYKKLVSYIQDLIQKLEKLNTSDPYRIKMSDSLAQKLYHMGIINSTSSLKECENINVSSFCRRRLPVILVKLNMSENLTEATSMIEQGHIRIGPNTVTDTAFLITRNMEDFITWVDNSKIRKHIMKYSDQLDDYDLMLN